MKSEWWSGVPLGGRLAKNRLKSG